MMDGRKGTPDDGFDVDFANRLARLESYNKHLYRPNTYLHKWWARRCGSTFRLILKSFGQQANEHGYYVPGGLEGKIVLDPMLGGGTTLHEALRMGANVIGRDVDPIPVLQARATLSNISTEKVEGGFAELLERLESKLTPLFVSICRQCETPQPTRYLLYGLRQWCDCGEAVFVDSFIIRRERDGSMTRLCEFCQQIVKGTGECHCRGQVVQPALHEKTTKRCHSCGSRFRPRLGVPFYLRYRPLVSVIKCLQHGLQIQPVVGRDLELIAQANSLRGSLVFASSTAVKPGPKSDALIRQGIMDFQDLYSSRQLMYLRTAVDGLALAAPDVRSYLALLVSTSLEFNVMLCGYKGSGARRAGAIRHAFSHHAYSFPHTAVENNPVYDGLTSGSLRQLFHDRVRRARLWAGRPRERSLDAGGAKFVYVDGEVDYGTEVRGLSAMENGQRRFNISQGSATALDMADGSVDYVVTDPPYYDSVQYGDLSAFFRVWLRQMLEGENTIGIDWDYRLSDSAVENGAADSVPGGDGHYLTTMSAIFKECGRVLKPQTGRLTFSFHHWKAAGWAAISVALKRAGFKLLEFYVVHSENPVSVHIANMNSLTDDAILVLANDAKDADREWGKVASIRTSSSALFCQDCAQSLGWILASGLTEEEIDAWWLAHLGSHAGRESRRPPGS